MTAWYPYLALFTLRRARVVRDRTPGMSDLDNMLDLWRKQSALNHALSDEIKQLHAELAELRDGMVALSNRLQAVTRASMSTDFPGLPRGRGDTITVVPE